MAVTPTLFKTRFPEFDGIDDSRIQIFIDDAILMLYEPYWGTKYELGIYYLTAHYLSSAVFSENSIVGAAVSSGLVASKSVDGSSISFTNATPSNQSDAYFLSTAYGQRYIALRDSLGVPASVV
jgi:hypothetical protein